LFKSLNTFSLTKTHFVAKQYGKVKHNYTVVIVYTMAQNGSHFVSNDVNQLYNITVISHKWMEI